MSGGFVSSRLQSDKPLHHGPSLSAFQHFIFLCFTSLQSEIAVGNHRSQSYNVRHDSVWRCTGTRL